MANIDNLIPNSARTPEELRAMTVKGGIRSGEVRREKRSMKEALKILMQIEDEQGLSNQYKVLKAALEKALGGDIKAIEFIRDTMGEKPKETLEIENAPSLTFGKREDDVPDTNS